MSARIGDYRGPIRRALGPAALLLAVAGAWGQGQVPASGYVHEDVVISARQMYTFTVKGQTVNILLGDFSLTLGRRVLSGRDAVLWIKQRQLGPRVLRDVEVYIEGAASILEPDGTLAKGRRIFDVIRHIGAVRARVDVQGGKDLASFPLYRRAVTMRTDLAALPTVP
ncbi:hypothetical protein LCGC14_3122690, partial [marine sediment metagenome]